MDYQHTIKSALDWTIQTSNSYAKDGIQILKILINIKSGQPLSPSDKTLCIKILQDYSLYLKEKQDNANPADNYTLGLERFNVDSTIDYLSSPIINYEEKAYLNTIKKIIDQGESRDNRTGIETFSIFSNYLEFDLSSSFPLLTTRKMAWKSILRELLWFISGSTDATILQKQNVHIWDGNTTQEFLNKNGLNLSPGDIGPLYGFQWRHFGAEYKGCDANYENKGFDQLKYVENELKNNPTSRRILFSAWNPPDMKKGVLPPCHVLAQFYVRGSKYLEFPHNAETRSDSDASQNPKYLDIQVYQRSADFILGSAFNIPSYSCLCYMWANILGLQPGKLYYVTGDTHVYKNHLKGAQEQLAREPFSFPKLVIKRKVDTIFDYVEQDFEIKDYESHLGIKFEMAV